MPAVTPFTRLVADRILSVSDSRLRTSSIAAIRGCRSPLGARGASRSTIALTPPGSSGVMRNESGKGLRPSSS
jgi:hypothetical protein